MDEPHLRLEDDGEDAPIVSIAIGSYAVDDEYLDIAPEVGFGEPEEWSEEPTLRERVKGLERELLSIDRQRAKLFPRMQEFHRVRLLVSALHMSARTMGPDYYRLVTVEEHHRRLAELSEEMAELSGAALQFNELRARAEVLAKVYVGMRDRL